MDPNAKLEDLKAVAVKLSIDLEFSDLSDREISVKSGYCKLKNRDLIILDKNLPPEEQVEIILQTLKRFDTESVYLPSWVRERLGAGDPAETDT